MDALLQIWDRGVIGETYCIGGESERSNKFIVEYICEALNKKLNNKKSFKELIKFVKDRPGHDHRYSINPNKIKNQIKWKPKLTFEEGIDRTIDWYLNNQAWCKRVLLDAGYSGERIGLQKE